MIWALEEALEALVEGWVGFGFEVGLGECLLFRILLLEEAF